MGLQEEVLRHIDSLVAEAEKSLDDMELAAGLKKTQKVLIRDNLIEIVLSALADARQSAERDVSNPYFLLPYTVACIELGQAWGDLRQTQSRSALMSEYAKRRVAIDPKQGEKNFIFECWQKWQSGRTIYKGKAAFARDMLTKCEHLTSQKKIEDWCRAWESKGGTQPAE